MQSVIYDPLQEYVENYRPKHLEQTNAVFDELAKQSAVDVAKNRETVRLHRQYSENFAKLKRKHGWLVFWRVLMCITVVLIPLVILKTTPKIKQLKQQCDEADQKADELLAEAYAQMQPLCCLFTDMDAVNLVQNAVPLLKFEPCFSARQEADMAINYDFAANEDEEQSTEEVLAGYYNENPFVFENRLVHTMGTETYHGYKTIYWTETYRDSNGKLGTKTCSQTLHATVTKPKPFYSTQVVLNYCSQGGGELCFTRDATNLDEKSERAIERYIARGEKRLKKKTDKALRENSDFVSMSNTDFEVLFDALDRSDEVQFRSLFTPLAQTNMVSLLLSKETYGDDFHFVKKRRTNTIVSEHSQGRKIRLQAEDYASFDFDEIRKNFVEKNTEFFKAVYFDFAPLWAIPAYQERPVHSLKPIPDYAQRYSQKECEALANAVALEELVHPETKTQAILKSEFIGSQNNADQTRVTAYSYDIEKHVEIVRMYGNDGRYHDVPVEWDEYLPLSNSRTLFVCEESQANGQNVLAARNNLCMYY